ncbi:MAG TPA: hypothetical protein VNX86_13540 [Rhizomicrobium sp.]|jgi:hypothetical protein|nr:hypothetical protein [Rhizomicrobium sp.]
MGAMVRDLAEAIGTAVAHVRSDVGAPRALIDIVFDAFDEGGAGMLAAWIALSNKHAHLEPVRAAVGDLVRAIDERSTSGGAPPTATHPIRHSFHHPVRVRRCRHRSTAAPDAGSGFGLGSAGRGPSAALLLLTPPQRKAFLLHCT